MMGTACRDGWEVRVVLAELREAVEKVRTCRVAMVEVCDSALEVLRFSGDSLDIEIPRAFAFAINSSSIAASDTSGVRWRTWVRYSASSSSIDGRTAVEGAMSGVEHVWPASEAMTDRVGRAEGNNGQVSAA